MMLWSTDGFLGITKSSVFPKLSCRWSFIQTEMSETCLKYRLSQRNHQVEMKDRAVHHLHSSGRRSHLPMTMTMKERCVLKESNTCLCFVADLWLPSLNFPFPCINLSHSLIGIVTNIISIQNTFHTAGLSVTIRYDSGINDSSALLSDGIFDNTHYMIMIMICIYVAVIPASKHALPSCNASREAWWYIRHSVSPTEIPLNNAHEVAIPQPIRELTLWGRRMCWCGPIAV